MTYFPKPVFRNIASFLIDPYYKERKAHAEVWQKIRVLRVVESLIFWNDMGIDIVADEDSHFYLVGIKRQHTATAYRFCWNAEGKKIRTDFTGTYDNVLERKLNFYDPDVLFCEEKYFHNFKHSEYDDDDEEEDGSWKKNTDI